MVETVKILRTHDVEVPCLNKGRPSYRWTPGYTYVTKNGGQACADTLHNTRYTCEQEWPNARIVVDHK